jgi:hypothetical protein
MTISVNNYVNSLELSTVYKNEYFVQYYIGYSLKDAKNKFKNYVHEQWDNYVSELVNKPLNREEKEEQRKKNRKTTLIKKCNYYLTLCDRGNILNDVQKNDLLNICDQLNTIGYVGQTWANMGYEILNIKIN